MTKDNISPVRKIVIEFNELDKQRASSFVTHILQYMGNHNVILNRLEVNGGNIHG